MRRVPSDLVGQASGRRQSVALAHLVGDLDPVVVLPEHAVLNPCARPGRHVPEQRRARRPEVAAIDVFVYAGNRAAGAVGLAVRQVLDVAVPLEFESGDADRHVPRQRHVDRAFRAPVGEAAQFHIGKGVKTVRRGHFRHYVQRAARGVAAEQRPLRTAKDLDALQVEELDRVQIGGDRDLVDVRRHPCLAAAGNHELSDAADAEVRSAEVRRAERDVRHVQLQIGRIDDLALVDHVVGQRRDRDGHVLDALLDTLGRDDHLFHFHGRSLRLDSGPGSLFGRLRRCNQDRTAQRDAPHDSTSHSAPLVKVGLPARPKSDLGSAVSGVNDAVPVFRGQR